MDLPHWVLSEEERVQSFKYWAYQDGPCSPLKMAEAGFHSTGQKSQSEVAICYVCFKELDGWEEEDDPWNEHRKHSPNCLYVKIGKTPSLLSVEDLLTLEVERTKNFIYKQHEKTKAIILKIKEQVTEQINRISSSENNGLGKGQPRSSAVKRSSRRK